MFHIITSIGIVLLSSYLQTVENKVWTRRPNVTYQIPFVIPTTFPDYYDDVLGHINDSHYYVDTHEDITKKYEDAKTRIVGWKRVYASLRIHYQNISTHHQNLSVHHQNLSVHYKNLSAHHYKHAHNAYIGMLRYKGCFDLLRDYIPSIERDFVQHKQGFEFDFKKSNPTFTKEYRDLHNSLHKIFTVYEVLRSTGLKFDNRSICSFKYMSAKEYYGPLPEYIENWPTDDRNNLNKCEQWIFFLNAVRKEQSPSKNIEILIWQTIIEKFEKLTRKPYPLLVQNIFNALYWSHQHHHVHHAVQSVSEDTMDKETRAAGRKKEKMYCLYYGLLTWQFEKKITFTPTTSPLTTPIFQQYLEGGKPTTTVDPDDMTSSGDSSIDWFGLGT